MSRFHQGPGILFSLFIGLLLSTLVRADEAGLPARVQLLTHDFPPFAYLRDGQVAGPVRELIDRACAAIEVRCEHRLLPWSRAQAIVRLGKADGLYVIGFNEARSRWLHFSTPLLETEYGIFVPGDNRLGYQEPQDLAGYRVGVYGPSNTSLSLERLHEKSSVFEIEASPDNEAAWRQLAAGRLDAIYSNRDVGRAVMARLKLNSVRYAGPARKLDYHVGFSRQTLKGPFPEAFSAAYRQLEAQGVVRDVMKAHGLAPDNGGELR